VRGLYPTHEGGKRHLIRKACAVSGVVFFLAAAQVCSAGDSLDSIRRVCQKAFWEVQPGASVTTPEILAPNKLLVAWSVATWHQAPDVFRSAVIIRDERTRTLQTILRTQTDDAGKIVGPNPKAWGNADQFCVIDWSRDSRHLLIQEVVGPMESDNTALYVWVYDLHTKRRSVIPVSALHRAITGHWTRKGANFRDVAYVLYADGWEDSEAPRPAFIAKVFEGSPTNFPSGFDGFLGVWSVSLSGAAPKLVTDDRNLNVVRRYGQVQSKQP